MFAINLFLQINPDIMFIILITAIIKIHIQSQIGMSIAGIILIEAAKINMKSATVSKCEPNVLKDFVFLAISPSIISVNPQIKYIM